MMETVKVAVQALDGSKNVYETKSYIGIMADRVEGGISSEVLTSGEFDNKIFESMFMSFIETMFKILLEQGFDPFDIRDYFTELLHEGMARAAVNELENLLELRMEKLFKEAVEKQG